MVFLESILFWTLCITMGVCTIGTLILFWGMMVIIVAEQVSEFRKAGKEQDSNELQRPPF